MTELRDVQFKEWEAWKEVCVQLKKTHAVTLADCNSPEKANETPGQQLFQAIRQWGIAYAKLCREAPEALEA